MVLKDILSPLIMTSKPAAAEMFEKVDFYDKTYQYLYHENSEGIFTVQDIETFETEEFPLNLIKDGGVNIFQYTEGGHEVTIRFHDDKPVYVSAKKILKCTVAEIISGNDGSPATAILASGTKIQVPSSVKVHDVINVDTSAKTMVQLTHT